MPYRSLPGPKGDTGPMGDIIWKGAWSAETTYAADDAVTNGGSSYMATDASTDIEPGVDEGWEGYWDVFAVKGAAGDQGTQGEAGPQGETGAAGTDGEPGVNGATWLIDPGSEDGVIGDLALSTGQYAGLVERKSESGWGEICNIMGPQGDQGATGDQGDPGQGFAWQGAWQSGHAYAANDLVREEGVWLCILSYNGSGDGPSADPTHWEQFAEKGSQGDKGDPGDPGSNTPINLTNLPTSDPAVAGAPWNNDGTLDFSAGN